MDCTVRLWEAQTGQEMAVLRGHSGPVIGLVFVPGGPYLATAGWDQVVKVWDLGPLGLGSTAAQQTG
jgi:WD40 repeat protein